MQDSRNVIQSHRSVMYMKSASSTLSRIFTD